MNTASVDARHEIGRCPTCRLPVLHGQRRRGSRGDWRHTDCGVSEYQYRHPDMTLAAAARHYLALRPAEHTPSATPGGRPGVLAAHQVSNVTITHPDGTTTTTPAYTNSRAASIAAKGQRQPREWDETVSRYAGGTDRTR